MNNSRLKKCEKSVTDVKNGKQWKGDFLVKFFLDFNNDRECFA